MYKLIWLIWLDRDSRRSEAHLNIRNHSMGTMFIDGKFKGSLKFNFNDKLPRTKMCVTL